MTKKPAGEEPGASAGEPFGAVAGEPQPGDVLFHEVQRIRQPWLIFLVALCVAGAWFSFVSQILMDRPFGDRPAPDLMVWFVCLFFGIALPVFFFLVKMEVTVTRERVLARFFPLARKEFSPADISKAYARTYHPIKEYGGWGIRWGPRSGRAYNASGNRGIQLELADGNRFLIGSQKPEELAAAIGSMSSTSASAP